MDNSAEIEIKSIINNLEEELKILIILSVFRLEICGPSSILSYCNINTLRG